MTNKLSLAGLAVLLCTFLAYYFWSFPAKVASGVPQQELAGLDASPASAPIPIKPSAQQLREQHTSPQSGVVESAGTPIPETLFGDTAAAFAKANKLDDLVDIYKPLDEHDLRRTCAVDTAVATCNASERMSAGADSPHKGVLREFHQRYCQRTKARAEYEGTPVVGGVKLLPPNTRLPSNAENFSTYAAKFYGEGSAEAARSAIAQTNFNPEEKLTLKRLFSSALKGDFCDVEIMVTVLSDLEKAGYRDHIAMATRLDNLTPQERPIVFRLATRMAACSGGNPACGPGGLLTINFCMRRFMCTPGLSLMEAYRLTNSPLVYDSAKQIADYYASYP